jgi:anti-sigma-K factor RskA
MESNGCERRILELLPDYHLGHLPSGEAREVERHLETCEECREALEEISGALDVLPFVAVQEEPSAHLKARILAEIREEEPAPEAPEAREPYEPAGRRWWLVAPLAAAAAVCLVALGALGWAYLDLREQNRQLQAEVQELRETPPAGELLVAAAEGTDEAPQARGTAIVDPADGTLALAVFNLPAPPEGHGYRAWLVRQDGEVLGLGEMNLDDRGDGRMTGTVSEPVSAFRALELTVEPTGAQEKSGPVYLQAGL